MGESVLPACNLPVPEKGEMKKKCNENCVKFPLGSSDNTVQNQ